MLEPSIVDEPHGQGGLAYASSFAREWVCEARLMGLAWTHLQGRRPRTRAWLFWHDDPLQAGYCWDARLSENVGHEGAAPQPRRTKANGGLPTVPNRESRHPTIAAFLLLNCVQIAHTKPTIPDRKGFVVRGRVNNVNRHLMVRPRVFFDISVDNTPVGRRVPLFCPTLILSVSHTLHTRRVIFELFNDTAPKTAEK